MLNINERTFGLELEFGNLFKQNVELPAGYKFSPDERSIVNSTRTRCTPAGNFGAEVNTRPLKPNMEDVRELRSFIYKCLKNWDGRLMWNTGFDGHIFIGDLGLEELKRIFILGYYTTRIIKDVFHLGAWFDVDILVPSPSREMYEKVKSCETLESLKNAFANSSNRGHWRFPINIMPYFKTQTLEYRIFNSTADFRETLETIKFMYSFLDYALTHTEEDFANIKTADDFRKVFNITHDFAKATPPLIFAEDSMVFTSNIAKGFAPTSKIVSAIAATPAKRLILVNPFEYSAELQLSGVKDITIVNNEEYANAIYEISQGRSVTYTDEYEVLNQYKDGTPLMDLALFFVFARLQRYNLSTEYGQREFGAYVEKIPESLAKIKQRANNLLVLFNKATYTTGTIWTAMAQPEGGTIVYQQCGYGKHNSVMHNLKKHSDWAFDWFDEPCDYQNVIEACDNAHYELMVVSKNAYLPLNKVAKDGNVYLYSNTKQMLGCRIEIKKQEQYDIEIPTDDYEITPKTRLTLKETNQKFFSYLQQRFIKKVQKTTPPNIGFVLCDGNLILGAFGFNYSKDKDYSLWLLSDFCTNNEVPRLAKLMLYVIRSKEVKSALERKLNDRIKNGYTKVYTNLPVSMKYRGAFHKVGRQDKCLVYDFDFGSVPSLKAAVMEYLQSKKKGEQ